MPFAPWTPGGALLAAARGMDGFPSPSLSRSRACVRGRRKENSFFIPCHPLPSEREKARPVRMVIAGRFAASPHPKARTIQRPGERV